MTRKLSRHPKALTDIEESAVYIGADNLDAALRFLNAVETTLQVLLDNPELGHTREFKRPELAEMRSFNVKGTRSGRVRSPLISTEFNGLEMGEGSLSYAGMLEATVWARR